MATKDQNIVWQVCLKCASELASAHAANIPADQAADWVLATTEKFAAQAPQVDSGGSYQNPSSDPETPHSVDGSWRFPFGKHEGESLDHIYATTPSYLSFFALKGEKPELKQRVTAYLISKDGQNWAAIDYKKLDKKE